MTNAEWEAANEDDSDRWARYPAQTGLYAPNSDQVVWRDRGARIAALEAENAELRELLRRTRANAAINTHSCGLGCTLSSHYASP
jgi:hypothetical protein